jgi:hypothetical protein
MGSLSGGLVVMSSSSLWSVRLPVILGRRSDYVAGFAYIAYRHVTRTPVTAAAVDREQPAI